jgi:hypothetical protein
MGGIGKAFGKVLDFAKPILTAVNPLLGAAAGFASGLMQGKNPLQSLLGAATDLIPGGGIFKNLLGSFGGSGLLDGAGGNSLLSGALNLATGKSKITDILGDLTKSAASKGGLTDLGLKNAQELAAQRMAQMIAR